MTVVQHINGGSYSGKQTSPDSHQVWVFIDLSMLNTNLDKPGLILFTWKVRYDNVNMLHRNLYFIVLIIYITQKLRIYSIDQQLTWESDCLLVFWS